MHRNNYIDQVDPRTGKINYLIGEESSEISSNDPILSPPSNTNCYQDDNHSSTEMATVAQEDAIPRNSVEPEGMSDDEGNGNEKAKSICTKDLLVWAFQTARGMEYLASRKVLHGDLAARNILLADKNVVKICDFGFARSIYKNDSYKKQGNDPLPIKWMAIESMKDRIFSTQSDIWSFGIVLWEFFSLASTPYPGIEADERLYHKLVFGYRMDPPKYSPKEVYKMMTDCWASVPQARPSFKKLTKKIGDLLEDTLRAHYIDLNDPYLAMNARRFDEGQTDYLALLSPPTVPSSPACVNESDQQETLQDSGYVGLEPSTIFSGDAEQATKSNSNLLNSEDQVELQLHTSSAEWVRL